MQRSRVILSGAGAHHNSERNVMPNRKTVSATVPQAIESASRSTTKPSVVHWRRVRTLSAAEDYQLLRAPFKTEGVVGWVREMFSKPSAEELAQREYEEARRNLLQCQRMREYYDSMCRFETKRIKRLQEMLKVEVDA